MRHALACALLLALALIATVGTLPAQAELQLGIQDDALLTSQEPNAWPFARGLSPKVVRYNVAWEQVAATRPVAPDDPADPAYDFRRADAMDRKTAAIGAQSLFTIVNAPRWANAGKAPRYAPLNADDYGQFCGVVAWRYSGTYTPPGALVPLPAVKNFTVWNEPNRGQYLLPQGVNGQTAAATSRGSCARAPTRCTPCPPTRSWPQAPSRAAEPRAARRRSRSWTATARPAGRSPSGTRVQPVHERARSRLQAGREAGRRRDHASQPRSARALAEQVLRRQRPDLVHGVCMAHRADAEARDHLAAKQADLLRKTVTLVRTHYPYAKLLVWYLVRDESPTSYWRSGLATFDWQQKPAYGLYKVLAGI